MNINDQFPSKWLTAEDLRDRDVQVTIASITVEELGDHDRKPVLYFQGHQKGLVLNKTNSTNIASVYGPETDSWIGKSIVLYSTWVDFSGRSVKAIRVRPEAPRGMAQETAPPPTDHAMQGPAPDDEIVF